MPFIVHFYDKGKWSELGYKAEVSIKLPTGTLIKGIRGSTFPNPYKPKNPEIKLDKAYGCIQTGEYRFEMYPYKGHPALLLNKGGKIPTINANPNQNGNHYATEIFIHKGWNEFWRGSAACLTIHPDDWDVFISYFDDNSIGTVIVEREYNEIA